MVGLLLLFVAVSWLHSSDLQVPRRAPEGVLASLLIGMQTVRSHGLGSLAVVRAGDATMGLLPRQLP